MNEFATPRSNLLRNSLRGNAAFSILSGTLLILTASPLATWLGSGPPIILTIIGLSLLIFAAGLVHNASRETINILEAKAAVALDGLWVLGSYAIIALGLLSTKGNWLVAMVADVVLVFSILQYFGIRNLKVASRQHV